MTARHNHQSASPRFPRGLALVSLAGALVLLAYGSLHQRAESDSAKPSAVSDHVELSQPVQKTSLARRSFQDNAPRESRLTAAFTGIETETEASQREEMWAKLTAGVSLADIPSALDELQRDGLGGHEFSQRLLRRWAAADGSAAAAWAVQLPPGVVRESALSAVAIEWANTSLSDATSWAGQLPDETERAAAQLVIANEAVRTEPVEALRLAVELPDTPQRDELIRRAAMEWTTQDLTKAIAWAEQIPDQMLRAKVLADEAVSWAEQNPADAAAFAVAHLPVGRIQEDAVIAIIQRWAQQQPDMAAAWVEQFPQSALRATAVENLVAQWSEIDVDSARRWLAKHS